MIQKEHMPLWGEEDKPRSRFGAGLICKKQKTEGDLGMIRQQREKFAERYGRSQKETEACVSYVKKQWPQETAHRMRIAEEVVRHYFLFDLPWDMEQTTVPVEFPGEIDWCFQPGEDPEFIYQMNRHRYWVCLGQAYAPTGEEAYGEAFASQLTDWLQKNPVHETTKSKTWRTIEAGLRGESWIKAMGYFVKSSAVTDEVFRQFLDGMALHGAYLAACEVPFSVKSNWGVLENSGLYAIARMLEHVGGYPEASSWAELAKARLIRQIGVQVLDDGVHWEMSPMYHNEVLKCFLEAMRNADLAGDRFPAEFREKVRDMAMADRIWQKPDNSQFAGGDSDATDLRDVLTVCASYFQDPVLKSGGYGQMDFEGIWDYGTEAAAAYEMLEAELPAETFTWQRDSGNFFLRSGWEKDSDYFHLRCGSLGGGHGHFDKGHMDLTIGGEDLLIDPGRYTYVDGADRRKFKSAAYHNSVTVDGAEYTHPTDSWGVKGLLPALSGMCCRKGDYSLMECGHLGYMDSGVYVERRVLAVGTRIYVVMDTCYGTGAHTLTQHFHLAPEADFQIRGRGFVMKRGQAQAEFWCMSGNARVMAEPSEISRHYNQKQDGRVIRIEAEGHGVFSLVTVIFCGTGETACMAHPVPVMTAGGLRQLSPSEGDGVELTAGNRIWVVVNAHVEAGADCEYLGAEGSYGLGRVMIAEKGEKDMTVLRW